MKSLTLEGFANALANMQARTPIMLAIAAESVGQVAEGKAKAIVGEYQRSDLGGFESWEELAESTKSDRLRKGYAENDPGLRSGAMMASITHITNGTAVAIGSSSQKLVWFERGTSKQSPRSVVGLAAYRCEDDLRLIAEETIGKIL